MRTVAAFEAKTHLSQLLDDVEHRRDRIVIERRGKRVAALVPYEEADSEEETRKWLLAEIEEIIASQEPGQPPLRAEDLIEEGRER